MSGEITGQIHITRINSWLLPDHVFCTALLLEMKVGEIFLLRMSEWNCSQFQCSGKARR